MSLADDIPELLSSSSLFSMLLPLIIAYIGPVAAAILRCVIQFSNFESFFVNVILFRLCVFPCKDNLSGIWVTGNK